MWGISRVAENISLLGRFLLHGVRKGCVIYLHNLLIHSFPNILIYLFIYFLIYLLIYIYSLICLVFIICSFVTLYICLFIY